MTTTYDPTCDGCHGSRCRYEDFDDDSTYAYGCPCPACSGCEACPECDGCGVVDCDCGGQCHDQICDCRSKGR
jgi:hypothetical protein